MEELKLEPTIQLVEGGHRFFAYEYRPDQIDVFRMDYDYHNGPECRGCGQTFCQHCEPLVFQEQCLFPNNDVIVLKPAVKNIEKGI